MNSVELKKLIDKIVGLQLTSVTCVCDMMKLHFDKYAIHTQCLTRIIKNGDILVTTFDYQSWDGEVSENNDEWYNLNKYKTDIEGGTVTSVELNSLCDLIITLDNDITIQILIENSYAHYDEEHEQYRFFEIAPDNETEEQEKERKHYVVYSKHTDIN